MHELLIATALSSGLLATPPQTQAQPGVIAIAVAQTGWVSIASAAGAPTAGVASTKRKISPQHAIRQPRSTSTKLAAAFIGALAGFYVGGHLGAALDQSGGDSPGMAGLMYGACIGTGAGAVIGWKLAR